MVLGRVNGSTGVVVRGNEGVLEVRVADGGTREDGKDKAGRRRGLHVHQRARSDGDGDHGICDGVAEVG